MIRWAIAAAPVVLSILAYGTLITADFSPGEYRVLGIAARVAAAIGCFIAAFQFDRSDYMRRAWSFFGLGFVLLTVNAVLFGVATHSGARDISSTSKILSGLVVLVANAATVVGAVMVARAWKKAGLSLTVSSTARNAVTAASLLVGLVVAGPSTFGAMGRALGGHLDALTNVASGLGDIATLAVLGPILLTAIALRGGSLAWPWSLIVLGTLGWLFYDATLVIADLMKVERAATRPLEEAFRILACLSFLSAGVLQMLVVRRSAAAASEPRPA